MFRITERIAISVQAVLFVTAAQTAENVSEKL